ncbi:hypothetical protein TVAG_206560 [Trichomonas vaginalis G3]|uniref:Uncharacterized protein n=1 Tax=Trichomonas vaginalis (strain ATCC PRA-98 / G3) TaxID=412133 RepID=A2G1I3_TRIV3|nr:hypothetical protein TVAGG3_0825150 [Trichomonas vaginalis G3]EAX88977.1 hypothetical protein TVAG_206560 [Trichomonas vaginalis G3]KAI5498166.1 hypothetical protein TVAGG3_0825150 [Trichomonas vaginalis G3]|eukprot:XP_001301907.1 hypothetical protein [Trichomonas vaginalis G3]
MFVLFFFFTTLIGCIGPRKPNAEQSSWEEYEKKMGGKDNCHGSICSKEKPAPASPEVKEVDKPKKDL